MNVNVNVNVKNVNVNVNVKKCNCQAQIFKICKLTILTPEKKTINQVQHQKHIQFLEICPLTNTAPGNTSSVRHSSRKKLYPLSTAPENM